MASMHFDSSNNHEQSCHWSSTQMVEVIYLRFHKWEGLEFMSHMRQTNEISRLGYEVFPPKVSFLWWINAGARIGSWLVSYINCCSRKNNKKIKISKKSFIICLCLKLSKFHIKPINNKYFLFLLNFYCIQQRY